MVKVRFAPSPTGIPHIGNTRTALFNFLFARHTNGKFILRIEDTDRTRFVKGAEEAIIEIFKWLEISWDEKFTQSERLPIYKEHAEILRKQGSVYENEGALRFKMPKNGETFWDDAVGDKKIAFKNENQEDFVIIKSDGYPTYNFANVVDDYLMDITHIIRGEEFISSTPKHVQLYKAFGWNQPIFAHLPVILGSDKTKFSKRHGAKSVLDYRGEGFLKEALLNFMALLGWSRPRLGGGARLLDKRGREQEIFPLEQLIRLFDLKDINTANPIFDIKKLEWLNGVWIRSINDFDDRLKFFYKEDKDVIKILNSKKADLFINSAKSRMKTLADFKNLISQDSNKKKTNEDEEVAMKLLKYLNEKLEEKWKDKKLLVALKDFSNKENVSFKKIYFLMTGREKGIGILELNEIYGREFFIKNLTNG